MAEKVAFDGANKLIIVNTGETSLDAQRDIYSAWKRWLIEKPDNAKWLQALRTIAGDPITGDQVVSPYFFLVNGWQLRPYEGDHYLVVDGNLFVDGGGNPFTPTVGNYNVTINLLTSSKSITTTVSPSAEFTETEKQYLLNLPTEDIVATQVWDELLSLHTSAGTAGLILSQIKRLVNLIPGLV